jgi:hypothetical protein
VIFFFSLQVPVNHIMLTVFKISFLVRLDSLHENEKIYDIKNIKENKNALLYILVIRLHSNLL